MNSRDGVVMEIMRESYTVQSQVLSDGYVAGTLRRDGLLPMMGDPQTRLFQEVEAVKETLGCDDDTAKVFLLRSVLQSKPQEAEERVS